MASSTELFRQEKRIKYTRDNTENLTPEMEREIRKLAVRPMDEAFNDPDFPPATELGQPVIGRFYKPIKKPVTLRVDADMLAWYKANFKPYQRKMNEVLRAFAEANTNQ